jgi:hypothetical protein
VHVQKLRKKCEIVAHNFVCSVKCGKIVCCIVARKCDSLSLVVLLKRNLLAESLALAAAERLAAERLALAAAESLAAER